MKLLGVGRSENFWLLTTLGSVLVRGIPLYQRPFCPALVNSAGRGWAEIKFHVKSKDFIIIFSCCLSETEDRDVGGGRDEPSRNQKARACASRTFQGICRNRFIELGLLGYMDPKLQILPGPWSISSLHIYE